MEGGVFIVDIVLVHLIRKYKEVFSVGEFDHRFNIIPGEDLTGRVARVDDDDGSDVAPLLPVLDRPVELLGVEGPVSGVILFVTCRTEDLLLTTNLFSSR